MSEKKIKYSSYLPVHIVAALKCFAGYKDVPAAEVIKQALVKCIPERFFKDPYKGR